jgi:hypothetical protein
MRVNELDESALDRFDLLVLGNLNMATREQCDAIARRRRHVLFEHDYRMCRHRGNHARARAHRWLGRCVCREKRFAELFRTALGVVFLTRRQLARYRANPFLRLPSCAVLGCSVMGSRFFEAVRKQREQPVAKRGTVVVHSARSFKGFPQALAYCAEHRIEPTIVRDVAPDELLAILARSERLVFLPEWYEPASRLAVEARFLGCEVVTNDRLGVGGEPWWTKPDDVGLEVLGGAAKRFWEIVDGFALARNSVNAPHLGEVLRT